MIFPKEGNISLMEHSESFKKIEPYLKQKRRIDHTSAILYYDLATTCGEKGLADEGDLLDYWAGEEAKIFQAKEFASEVNAGLADPHASAMEHRLFEALYEQVVL